MTRGKFVLITDKQVYISIEFNGDMYPDGHGVDAFRRLIRVNDVDEFMNEVSSFNNDNFQYREELVFMNSLEWFKQAKDFRKDYFDMWFSDWLYIKNISSEPVEFITRSGAEGKSEKRKVMQGEVVAFNFGGNPSQEDKDYIERNLKE